MDTTRNQKKSYMLGLNEYSRDSDVESIRNDDGHLTEFVWSQINNIVKARDVKFQLHEFTAQMNEVFPCCQQLMELRFQLVENGGLVFEATRRA
jgi:hypothetical protein